MGTFFTMNELSPWLEDRRKRAIAEVASCDATQVRFSPEAVAAKIASEYVIDPIELHWDHLRRSEVRETRLEMRHFGETSSFDGREVTIYIPVSGPVEVLRMRASRSWVGGYPDVDLVGRELVHRVSGRNLTVPGINAAVETLRNRLDETVSWVNADTAAWNRTLPKVLEARTASRRATLDENAQLSDALTIPLRVSADAPELVPVRAKRITFPAPPPGTKKLADPQIEQVVYEEIVETIRRVGNTAERLPATAAKFDEEEWRDLLLFILNASFEGAVQGEAFNGAGKTDLLLRFQDRNAFIGECKFWSGTKAFGEAIDQLLGYTVWRDSKAALILFIRNRDATAVIAKADAAIRSHACFLAAKPAAAPESRRDYLVSAKDDAERRLSLAFLPIVVRTAMEPDDHSTPTP